MVCCQKLRKTSERTQEPSNFELVKRQEQRQEQLRSSQSRMCQELKERMPKLNCKWPLKIQQLILSGRRQERSSGMIRVDRSQQRTNWPVDRIDQQRPQWTKRLKISVK
jgi:hypothetical protein